LSWYNALEVGYYSVAAILYTRRGDTS
jgi:hypothetical protein